MIFSIALPTCTEGLIYPVPFCSVENLVQIAQRAESLGYHSVWGNDHMVTQKYVREEFETPPRYWEPLITYAYLAAVTKTLRFGTGILALPLRRDIVVIAKQIATLDHISGGRFELGVGIGAYREEFEALWPDSKAHRGDMTEEGVEALGNIFTNRVASFEGKYYKYRDAEIYPKPLQKKLPIYFAGNNDNHIRRVVDSDFATGWIPAAIEIGQLGQKIDQLRTYAASKGKDPAEISIAPQFVLHVGRNKEEAIARFRQSQLYKHLLSLRTSTLKNQAQFSMEDINLIGSVDEVVERVARLREIGAGHLCGMIIAANDLSEFNDQMQLFAEQVIPRVK